MRFIADFHIHSHYSRATSSQMNIQSLARWGQLKGVQVMGTGDFTHPKWLKEMEEKLDPAEDGLFTLRADERAQVQNAVPKSCQMDQRFILTVEVSCIYKKANRVRKMHCVIIAPSFVVAKKINAQLQLIGNLNADGRPILGLDAKELLKIVLDASPDCLFVPAHAWTPHFSVFGSMSGFDHLHEAFDELTPHIVAIETGLSSDPPMNWRLSQLDTVALISNSDAHSPQKIGREANVFDTELTYPAIAQAIRANDRKKFASTIEFFPEEGKYHLDGHRLCGVRMEPAETMQHNGLCTKCGKPVTVGVLHRVDALADRPYQKEASEHRPYKNIIPLPELIAEVEGVGVNTQTVEQQYFGLLQALGNEFHILLDAPLEDIAAVSTPQLTESIRRVRAGEVNITAGFDGEYGSIHVLNAADKKASSKQGRLL